jgi:hypothetical protein
MNMSGDLKDSNEKSSPKTPLLDELDAREPGSDVPMRIDLTNVDTPLPEQINKEAPLMDKIYDVDSEGGLLSDLHTIKLQASSKKRVTLRQHIFALNPKDLKAFI